MRKGFLSNRSAKGSSFLFVKGWLLDNWGIKESFRPTLTPKSEDFYKKAPFHGGSEPLLDQRLRDKSTGKETRVRKLLFLLPSSENKIAISLKNKFRFARSIRSLSISIGRATFLSGEIKTRKGSISSTEVYTRGPPGLRFCIAVNLHSHSWDGRSLSWRFI